MAGNAAIASHDDWKPAHNPWLIAAAVMMATFMEVLDTSVANVSLRYIAGSLSVSSDEATWVLTSYLVSNAVILPATGWLGRRFGRRRFLITCIIIFTVASAMCGMANSLGMLILARIIQGAGGGALQPIAQAVLFETFPIEKRGSAMAVYAMGVVVAPILGPTLGGWITDSYSWRWVFYINLPIGILAVIMCFIYLEDPPFLKSLKMGKFDAIGLGLLTLWIGCLQVLLDKGQDEDWFSSLFIRWLAVGAIAGFIAFIIWELRVESPIVNLRILKDRNLLIGCVMMLTVGAILYGTTAMLPLFLQNLLAYPALQAGFVMSPRGFGAVIGSIVAGRVISKIDGRIWMAQGTVILGISMVMLASLTLAMAPGNVIFPIVISGFGVTSIFVPMSTFSVATVPRQNMGDATGMTSLLRNLGGSIGISVLTAFVTRGTQQHQALLLPHLTSFNHAFVQQLSQIQGALGSASGTVAGKIQGYGVIYQTLQQQAALLAYIDQFWNLVIGCFLLIPIVFLFKKGSKAMGKPPAGAH